MSALFIFMLQKSFLEIIRDSSIQTTVLTFNYINAVRFIFGTFLLPCHHANLAGLNFFAKASNSNAENAAIPAPK